MKKDSKVGKVDLKKIETQQSSFGKNFLKFRMVYDLRRFDIYRKVPKDLTQPTTTGAIISISSGIFILFLLVSELLSFMQNELISELYVDDPTTG